MIAAGDYPAYKTLAASDLGLPGNSNTFYSIYTVGDPSDNSGSERIASVPGSTVYYYSPYHYNPGPGAPNTWVQLFYTGK